jgi:hypothetical protein
LDLEILLFSENRWDFIVLFLGIVICRFFLDFAVGLAVSFTEVADFEKLLNDFKVFSRRILNRRDAIFPVKELFDLLFRESAIDLQARFKLACDQKVFGILLDFDLFESKPRVKFHVFDRKSFSWVFSEEPID